MDDAVSGGYAMYIEVLMSEMSSQEIANLLEMFVEDVKLMELQLLNAWIHDDTGEYFEDLPIGPKWLGQLICDRTDAMSKRMLKIWNKVLAEKLTK